MFTVLGKTEQADMQATNRRLKCFKTFAPPVEETSTVLSQVHLIPTECAHDILVSTFQMGINMKMPIVYLHIACVAGA